MPKPRVLRQWTEFDRHTLAVDMYRSDPTVYDAILRVMRKQDEIIREVEALKEEQRRNDE